MNKNFKKYIFVSVFMCFVFCFAGCDLNMLKESEEISEGAEIQSLNRAEITNSPSEHISSEKESSQEVEVLEKEQENVTSDKKIILEEETSDSFKLSEDIYSFQVLFNDDLYSLPISCYDFEKYGWEFTDKINTVLEPEEYVVSQTWERDGIEIYTSITNYTGNIANIKDGMITEMTFAMYMIGDKDVTITLPKDIILGKSHKNDIVQAYGNPTEEIEVEKTKVLVYRLKNKREVKLIIDKEKELLNSVTIENFKKPSIDSQDRTEREEL